MHYYLSAPIVMLDISEPFMVDLRTLEPLKPFRNTSWHFKQTHIVPMLTFLGLKLLSVKYSIENCPFLFSESELFARHSTF